MDNFSGNNLESILKFAAEYDDQCSTFFEMECQDRRYAFNWVQEQIYNLECDGNCSSSKLRCEIYSKTLRFLIIVPDLFKMNLRGTREIMDGCDDLLAYHNYHGNNITTWFDDGIPFAGIQTCTFIAQSTYQPWQCLDTGARGVIHLVLHLKLLFIVSLGVILAYLSIVVIFSAFTNITILWVYLSKSHMRNSLG